MADGDFSPVEPVKTGPGSNTGQAAMRLESAAVARGDLLAAADAAEVAELYSALAFATAEAAYA